MSLEEWSSLSGEISMTGPDSASEAAYTAEQTISASLLIGFISVIVE
jgi:hypothetical protein